MLGGLLLLCCWLSGPVQPGCCACLPACQPARPALPASHAPPPPLILSLHSHPGLQLLKGGRTVVAAVRTEEKAEKAFGQQGLLAGRQPEGAGLLFVESGVDVTNLDTLGEALFKGVQQVVVCTGAVFGR